jgi:hypothetical protein
MTDFGPGSHPGRIYEAWVVWCPEHEARFQAYEAREQATKEAGD